ncbi:MAG: ABC transporter permease [Chloroflexi bacterium]|nr:ABC transporter permease [Chloroflexota bacterium]
MLIPKESDWQTLKTAARNIQDRVERAGYTVVKVEVPEPGKLPQDNLYQAITLILGAMGAFSLFLAIFLIINTISALLIQQMQQIGVMKAVGAQPFHLISMYLGMVTLLGVLSLAIAIPLSIFVAGNAINVMAYFINYNIGASSALSHLSLFAGGRGHRCAAVSGTLLHHRRHTHYHPRSYFLLRIKQ